MFLQENFLCKQKFQFGRECFVGKRAARVLVQEFLFANKNFSLEENALLVTAPVLVEEYFLSKGKFLFGMECFVSNSRACSCRRIFFANKNFSLGGNVLLVTAPASLLQVPGLAGLRLRSGIFATITISAKTPAFGSPSSPG